MKLIFNKNFQLLLGILVIFFYYYLIIFLKIFNEQLFLIGNFDNYLSLAIVTDVSYLNLLLRDDLSFFYSFRENLNFFTLFYAFDRFFIQNLGFEKFWILLISYKLLAYVVLYNGLYKLFNFQNINLFIFSITLALIFCIDIPPFNDRYPRPQITNIFFFFIVTSSLNYLNQNKQSRFSHFIYGVSQSIIAFISPWASASLFFISSISFFFRTDKIQKIIILSGFFIFFIPTVSFYIASPLDSFHSEYLGIKEIYSRFNYLIDFYLSVFLSKKFIVLIFLQIMAGLIIKNYMELKLILASMIFTPLLFTFLGKTIQSYHLVNIFVEFQIIIGIYSFYKVFNYLINQSK